MAKLIYLYTSRSSTRTASIPTVSEFHKLYSHTTTHRFAVNATTDGMVKLFDILAKTRTVSETLVFIDSVHETGRHQYSPETTIYVVPHMSHILNLIDPGDVIMVRGGFKSWLPLIKYIRERRQNWLIFYAANTDRTKWRFWDIVLNDLIETDQCIRGRLYYAFSKPVNESVFGPIDGSKLLPTEYDVMIGASHIHRRKGQFRTVQALQKYYHLYGTKPHAIMPGGYIRCVTQQRIRSIISSGDVDIESVGGLSRNQLCLAMNRTRLFVHAGAGGQNDRGVLEALCCGLPVIIANPARFSPFVARLAAEIWDPKSEVHKLTQLIHTHTIKDKSVLIKTKHEIRKQYIAINGLYQVALPRIERLVEFILSEPKPQPQLACDWSLEHSEGV